MVLFVYQNDNYKNETFSYHIAGLRFSHVCLRLFKEP